MHHGASSLLVLCLVACTGTDDTDPTGDTELADTELGDTDTGDTDAWCLNDLDPASTPVPGTTETFAATGDNGCLLTAACPGGAAVTTSRIWSCETAVQGFYDGDGDVIAWTEGLDAGGCASHGYSIWYGPPVTDCLVPVDGWKRSAGCAIPRAFEHPTVVDEASVPPSLPSRTWAEEQATHATTCVGTRACTLTDGTELMLTYTASTCDYGDYELYDVDGERIGATTWEIADVVLYAPTLSEDARAEVDACITQTFTPSAGCGVVD